MNDHVEEDLVVLQEFLEVGGLVFEVLVRHVDLLLLVVPFYFRHAPLQPISKLVADQ